MVSISSFDKPAMIDETREEDILWKECRVLECGIRYEFV